jgi:hypothetical protein
MTCPEIDISEERRARNRLSAVDDRWHRTIHFGADDLPSRGCGCWSCTAERHRRRTPLYRSRTVLAAPLVALGFCATIVLAVLVLWSLQAAVIVLARIKELACLEFWRVCEALGAVPGVVALVVVGGFYLALIVGAIFSPLRWVAKKFLGWRRGPEEEWQDSRALSRRRPCRREPGSRSRRTAWCTRTASACFPTR